MAISFNRFQQKSQYLQLQAQEISCCIPLLQVNKIFSLMALISVPNTPYYLAGVFNYQGKVVPVIDLALRLGQQANTDYTSNTCVVLCNSLENESFFGLIVTAVGNVVAISHDDLQLAPQFSGKSPPFSAIYQTQQTVCFVLNTEALLNSSLTQLYSVHPDEINSMIQHNFLNFHE